jgi:hypothetical protein
MRQKAAKMLRAEEFDYSVTKLFSPRARGIVK